MKRIYLIRYGAYGDCLLITPVLRQLKKEGWHVILEYSDRGEPIFRNNPNIDEHIFYPANSVPFEELGDYWKSQEKKLKADKMINFSETIEVALALHPRSPKYNYTKTERYMLCNKNYYKYTMDYAKLECDDYTPELFFTKSEMLDCKQYFRSNKFNVLINLSGSGKHKAYPYMDQVMSKILGRIEDSHIITTGDYLCKLLESSGKRVTHLAGEVGIRTVMALTSQVQLVISPDTGVLHASGCYPTPKIGILGHSTIENITRYFENDYSVQADSSKAECAPCFRMIYDMLQQCPRDMATGGAWCMSQGIDPNKILDRVYKIYDDSRAKVTV